VPLDAYKIKIVDSEGHTVGYECEICGKRYIIKGFGGSSVAGCSSALTRHIKRDHPKEYEEWRKTLPKML